MTSGADASWRESTRRGRGEETATEAEIGDVETREEGAEEDGTEGKAEDDPDVKGAAEEFLEADVAEDVATETLVKGAFVFDLAKVEDAVAKGVFSFGGGFAIKVDGKDVSRLTISF